MSSPPSDRHHDQLIAVLEQLSSQVQQTAQSSPAQLDHVLHNAIHETAHLIQSTLPDHVGTPWLNQLSDLAPTQPSANNPHAKPPAPSEKASQKIHVFTPPPAQSSSSESQPSSPQQRCPCGMAVTDAAQHVKHPVECVHACGRVFHSATCRRKHTRQHARECPALQRNKILKQIGLSPDPELF